MNLQFTKKNNSLPLYGNEINETVNNNQSEKNRKKFCRIIYHQLVPYNQKGHRFHHHHRRQKYYCHGHNSQSLNRCKNCLRKRRFNTDISNTSINTCHEFCMGQKIREIFIKRPHSSTSKTEQYLIEDFYETVQRPSCCTSSEYCYHTDSTSLYGSQSSLSRNNSIKSVSMTLNEKRKRTRKEPLYSSVSLSGLNDSSSHSLEGSLIYTCKKPHKHEHRRLILSPSKVTIEHQLKTSTCKSLPEYACSPSSIRWSFLADTESKTSSEFDVTAMAKTVSDELNKSADTLEKQTCYPIRHRRADTTEQQQSSTAVIFWQDEEALNYCNNYYFHYYNVLLIDHDIKISNENTSIGQKFLKLLFQNVINNLTLLNSFSACQQHS